MANSRIDALAVAREARRRDLLAELLTCAWAGVPRVTSPASAPGTSADPGGLRTRSGNDRSVPVLAREIADVQRGPTLRRRIAELDGAGEVPGASRAGEAALDAAIREGAVQRVRPKAMTVAVIMAGLLPILLGGGAGSEVMQRIAAPMVGGMLTAPLLSMLVIPAAHGLASGRW